MEREERPLALGCGGLGAVSGLETGVTGALTCVSGPFWVVSGSSGLGAVSPLADR